MRFASGCVLVAVSVCLLAEGCSKGIPRATAATVLFVKGNVIFGKTDRNQFQPVALRSKIPRGEIVRTLDGAVVNLVLVPGAFVQLSGNSEIKIEELRLSKDGNDTAGGMRDRRTRVRLGRGRVSILFTRSPATESHFTLATNQATISPYSDCLFSVWTDGSTTRVTCAGGEVSAVGDEQTRVRIATGYSHRWPTTAKEPIAAIAEGDAQMDIMASLEAEKQLLNQAAGWQNRRVF
jgi:ferric-dicitrate binding protein FerR (iron transport regulator)